MWSVAGLGCAGCHGRDYGEDIGADYRGFPTAGSPKSSGYGLRLHHANAGIGICAICHIDPAPDPENVRYPLGPPPASVQHYYDRADVSLGGAAVDPCSNEDSGNDAGALGLDNDGDDLYDDAEDPDCTAHRIPVCAGTAVTIAVEGSTDNTNVGKGVISCDAAG